ncbi:primosomal protein N' (replication factor Y) [Mycetocola sp. BIGb0189]|uniref:primosomal protein N' family DNA-binding protein n=1 Tax=Mycetocola sp. BIGb0189 TaxID=2940604 RepID=UPI0021672F66|nr:primosomal protein N' [Mycetocola sp. BIGb0189]MCS4276222.1 primosomal protein N' (replication factor Y) [Mycetocola sp. BIGb0189]
MTSASIARVLIDSPLPQLDHPFDFRIPPELADVALPGVRVVVPWRSLKNGAAGYIVEVTSDAEFTGKLSDLGEVVSPARVLTPEVWALARRAADRAAGSANGILRLAVPGRQVRVERAWIAEHEEQGADVAPPVPQVSATPITGYPDALAEALAAHERIALDALPGVLPGPQEAPVGRWAITLAEVALDRYAAGESAILVVPDYRDLDQLLLALEERVPIVDILRMDAKQPNPDRYRAFLAALEPRPRIIIGNRSAVYAPAHNLGLIALWNDGDPLHAEPLAPYVHARDAALIRQEQSGAALVFAAHSRSVETQRLVEMGFIRPLDPQPRQRPKIIVTEQQDQGEGPAAAARIPSAAWKAIADSVREGPVLVQVSRPGYAPMLSCKRCGDAARCTACHGPLGIPSRGATPACTLCGHLAAGWVCATCEGTEFRLVTRGTGRTAEELGRAFPATTVIVADGEKTVLTVPDRPALIVATRGAEPIAHGGYRAVLLLDGDRMLAAESLSIASDCLRWWSHAAALAAPGAQVLLVGVGGELARAFATWNQAEFASAELNDRRALRFPPAVRLATITGQTDAIGEVLTSLEGLPAGDILGPVPVILEETGRPTGESRAVVRFDYAAGARVAKELRAAVIEYATKRRAPRAGARPGRAAPTLKVRFDDPEIRL